MHITSIAALIAFAAIAANEQPINKCIKDGKTTLTNLPCEGSEKISTPRPMEEKRLRGELCDVKGSQAAASSLAGSARQNAPTCLEKR